MGNQLGLSKPSSPVSNLPTAVSPFVGRDGMTGKIKEHLSNGGVLALTPETKLGKLAGLGASSLAVRYGREELGKLYPCGVWFIEADTDVQIDASFRRLAETLKVKESEEKSARELVEGLAEALMATPGWLIIFSQASSADLVGRYVPQTDAKKNQHVLITSYNPTGWPMLLPLEKPSKDAAVKLLWQGSGNTGDADDAFKKVAEPLATQLALMPNALALAAATMREHAVKPADYAKAHKGAKVPSKVAEVRAMGAAVAVAMDKVKKTAGALDALTTICFLAPYPLPQPLVEKRKAKAFEQSAEAAAAIKALAATGLISINGGAGSHGAMRVHRTVAAYVINSMKEAERCKQMTRIAEIVASHVEHDFSEEDTTTLSWLSKMGPHLEISVMKNALVKGKERRFVGTIANAVGTLNVILRGDMMRGAGAYGMAVDCLAPTATLDDPVFAAALDRYISLATMLEAWSEVVAGKNHLYTATKKKYGDESDEAEKIATELTELAIQTRELGVAAQMMQASLARIKSKHGDKSEQYITGLESMVELYTLAGEYGMAEPVLKEIITKRKKLNGEDDPKTLDALETLASLYYESNQKAKAENAYRDVLNVKKRTVGPDDLSYAKTCYLLGEVYSDGQKFANAVPMFEKAQKAYKAKWKPGIKDEWGTDYAQAMLSFSNMYAAQGKYHDSERVFKEASQVAKEVYGESSGEYAVVLNNFADMYRKMRRFLQSEKLSLQALKILKASYGETHITVAMVLWTLTELYAKLQSWDKAYKAVGECLMVYDVNLGQKSKEWRTVRKLLTKINKGAGKPDKLYAPPKPGSKRAPKRAAQAKRDAKSPNRKAIAKKKVAQKLKTPEDGEKE